MINTFKSYILTILALFFILSLNAQINFSTQSKYKYLKGNNAASLSASWITSDFDDSLWLSGAAPFRYGDGSGGTELDDMTGNYSTIFLRSTFTVENLSTLNEVTISANWDDGFALWINGEEA